MAEPDDSTIGDLCPKCDRVIGPDDKAAMDDFGLCQRCLKALEPAPWEEA
jgi:hypothetical protein